MLLLRRIAIALPSCHFEDTIALFSKRLTKLHTLNFDSMQRTLHSLLSSLLALHFSAASTSFVKLHRAICFVPRRFNKLPLHSVIVMRPKMPNQVISRTFLHSSAQGCTRLHKTLTHRTLIIELLGVHGTTCPWISQHSLSTHQS